MIRYYIRKLFTRRRDRKASVAFMAKHLLECAEVIESQRREIMVLRIRGEKLAEAIENNDWTVEYATKLCDAVSAWREMA